MSYQPAPSPAPAPSGPTGPTRRTGLLVLGVILLIAGAGVGIVLFLSSSSHYDDAVKGLQRAPIGCDTQFKFTGTGTFYFYAETKGKIGDLRGDCGNKNTSYDHASSASPSVDLTLVDSNGGDVKLSRTSSASYDTAGFKGQAIRSLQLDKPGDYTLSVASDATDFAIAVGRDPKSDAVSSRNIAIGVLAAGVVLGGLFIILGARRKPVPAAAPGSGLPPTAGFGAPPGGPVFAGPGQAPPPDGYARPSYPPNQVPPVQSPPPQYPPTQHPPPPVAPGQYPPAPGQPGGWGAPPQ